MINDQIFLKYQDRRIAVKNVSDIEKVDDKLYFTCQGRVEFLYDNSAWYKFFNVIIYSDKFDLKKIKHKAMIDMVYNPLNFVEKKNFSNFIGIVKGIFRLDFKNKQMRVCANKYFLPFKMIFKLNGKIRKVSFNFN
ncbi:MAG: hypothetical protein IKA36_03055 [Clostridia bacterium]|nr:hypothetical protein [Clostridia bacterium]